MLCAMFYDVCIVAMQCVVESWQLQWLPPWPGHRYQVISSGLVDFLVLIGVNLFNKKRIKHKIFFPHLGREEVGPNSYLVLARGGLLGWWGATIESLTSLALSPYDLIHRIWSHQLKNGLIQHTYKIISRSGVAGAVL